jgi:hypothetical protein
MANGAPLFTVAGSCRLRALLLPLAVLVAVGALVIAVIYALSTQPRLPWGPLAVGVLTLLMLWWRQGPFKVYADHLWQPDPVLVPRTVPFAWIVDEPRLQRSRWSAQLRFHYQGHSLRSGKLEARLALDHLTAAEQDALLRELGAALQAWRGERGKLPPATA